MELIKDLETLERIDSAPETLESNKENLIRMIKEFEFNSYSEKTILKAIEEPVNTKFFQYDLSPTSQRLFFKLTADDKKQLREEVRLINDHYHNHYHNNLDEEDRAKQPKKTVIDVESDKMSSIMGSSRYLVVSRNPVDILLCSTNQNYGSCYSMDSTYGYAFGVPAIIPNKDVYVCYLTKGKHGNYSIENSSDKYEFRYMRMLSRFFAYHCYDYKEGLCSSGEKQDMLGLGYIYPKDSPYNMNHNDIRFNVIANWFQQQNIEVIMPETKAKTSGQSCERFDYYYKSDGHRLKCIEDSQKYFVADNTEGSDMNPYYDNLNDLRGEVNYQPYNGAGGNYMELPDCGESPVTKIEYRKSWEDIYCENSDDYTECCDCGERHSNDDMYYIHGSDRYVCEECYNENYFQCHECGDSFHNCYAKEIYTADSDSTYEDCTICSRCYDRGSYYYCSECQNSFHLDDTQFVNDELYCIYCYEKNTTTCNVCDERIHKEDSKENFKGDVVCRDCYKGKMIKYTRTNSSQFIEFTIPKKMYFEVLKALKNSNQSLHFNKGGELFNKYRDYQKIYKSIGVAMAPQVHNPQYNNSSLEVIERPARTVEPIYETDWWRAEDVTKVFKRTKVNGQWFKTIITINWEKDKELINE